MNTSACREFIKTAGYDEISAGGALVDTGKVEPRGRIDFLISFSTIREGEMIKSALYLNCVGPIPCWKYERCGSRDEV